MPFLIMLPPVSSDLCSLTFPISQIIYLAYAICKHPSTLHCIHTSPHRQLLILIPQLTDLQERINPITLQTVHLQTSSPVLSIHPA